MTGSIDQFTFLVMEAIFGVLVFVGCYFSYILPIKILQNKRLSHQLVPERDQFPSSSSHASHAVSMDDHNHDTHVPSHVMQEDQAEKIVGYCNCFGAGMTHFRFES